MRMNLYIVVLLSSSIMVRCTQENPTHTGELPECIQTLIEQDIEKKILTIQTQFVNGEFHYWINTDAMHLDGSEDVLNSQCELQCQLCGFCHRPKCLDDYNFQDWEIIWKR